MSKIRGILITIGGLIIAVTIIASILLLSIRSEFAEYLDIEYPELSFEVGVTRINIIYGNYYAYVTCLDDNTYFPISKSFKTKTISEDYRQYKSTMLYNTKIKNIFDGRAVQNNIIQVTGRGKIPFESNAPFEQINIELCGDTDQIADTKEVLEMLKEKNFYTEKIIITYEKDEHIYEISLPSTDYKLTEKEIKSKVKMTK